MLTQLMHSDPLTNLKRSRFRREFHLTPIDIRKVKEIGLATLQDSIRDIIIKKLHAENDGHQTPKFGHPVFVSMHATATCCRKCLWTWHRIPIWKELDDQDIAYITNLNYRWIKNQLYLSL